eukprot:5169857-Prymnesium_polylepis.4
MYRCSPPRFIRVGSSRQLHADKAEAAPRALDLARLRPQEAAAHGRDGRARGDLVEREPARRRHHRLLPKVGRRRPRKPYRRRERAASQQARVGGVVPHQRIRPRLDQRSLSCHRERQ